MNSPGILYSVNLIHMCPTITWVILSAHSACVSSVTQECCLFDGAQLFACFGPPATTSLLGSEAQTWPLSPCVSLMRVALISHPLPSLSLPSPQMRRTEWRTHRGHHWDAYRLMTVLNVVQVIKSWDAGTGEVESAHQCSCLMRCKGCFCGPETIINFKQCF